MSRRDLLATLSLPFASAPVVAAIGRIDAVLRPHASVLDPFQATSALAETAVQAVARSMKFGYAAITWDKAIDQAMDDISAVGFRGIQLRIEAFQQYGDRPAALKERLQQRGLAFAALSSGNFSIDPAREEAELARHVRHAQFVRDAGGEYLQVIDERPKGREIVADDYRRLGRLLTTLAKRTADVGVPLVYHHHMNSLGERPNEIAAVLEAADQRHVGLLFDVAHYLQGGGDPVAAIKHYGPWIRVVHLKDVRSSGPGRSGESSASSGSSGASRPGGARGAGRAGDAAGAGDSRSNYQFVELGRGRVDLPGVFAALNEIRFGGWAIVELDRVPDPGRTPKESAEMNKRYLVERAHQIV